MVSTATVAGVATDARTNVATALNSGKQKMMKNVRIALLCFIISQVSCVPGIGNSRPWMRIPI